MVKRVAIVTGAGTGVGKAAALALLAEGYAVTLTGRRQQPLDKTAALAGDDATTLTVTADVGKPDAVKEVFAATKQTFGRLDVLFNNAGIVLADQHQRRDSNRANSVGEVELHDRVRTTAVAVDRSG